MQSKPKMHKMHINLASKKQRLLAGRAVGAGEKEEGRAYRPAHCTQFQVNGQRQMLISNEILWTIQLVQIFYHPTRRHIYDCRTGRHKAKPQVSGPPSPPLASFLAHTFSVCVCLARRTFILLLLLLLLSWAPLLSVLSSEQVKRKGEK